MPSLETPDDTITNIPTSGPGHNSTNDQTNQIQEEPNATVLSAELQCQLNEMEDLIQRISRMPLPIKKNSVNLYIDSLFSDNITLVEMLCKFSFPNMKLYDGTSYPDNHISQYKQCMFTTAILKDLRETCMCKGFSSSLTRPALQWYTNFPNNSIYSFPQLTDTFVK